MLKLAYFFFVAALMCAPIHWVARTWHTGGAFVGFSLLAVLLATVGLLRRP